MPSRDYLPVPYFREVHTVVFDFDGVFTDNKVYVDGEGHELVRCDRADGLAMDLVRAFQRKGVLATRFLVVSKERNAVVAARANKLGLDCRQGIQDKLIFLTGELAGQLSGDDDPFSGLVYLGNDINDLPVMERAGYSVAPNDAHPLVHAAASMVLPQNGGEGFVRAFIELFLRIADLSGKELNELISNC
jgi:3-deoxy-D-manno-octulosonate 8-phosphate phosphatase (KDO 8-P phosphatase)